MSDKIRVGRILRASTRGFDCGTHSNNINETHNFGAFVKAPIANDDQVFAIGVIYKMEIKDDQLVTGFYVPSKYDKTNVPKPTSEHVFIQENEASIYAVIRFSGGWREKNFKVAEERLRDYLNQNHYEIMSNRIIFRYQPPFIPGCGNRLHRGAGRYRFRW